MSTQDLATNDKEDASFDYSDLSALSAPSGIWSWHTRAKDLALNYEDGSYSLLSVMFDRMRILQ